MSKEKAKYNNPVSATFNGIVELFKKQKPPIGELHPHDKMEGKTCLVTGANSGLGFATALQLAERGAQVVMACRGGIPEAGNKIKSAVKSEKISMLSIDLSDIDSILNFIAEVKKQGLQFDVAIFNAAIVPKGSYKTKSGFDLMFLVNYLSKFILVNGLLEIGAIKKQDARIIFINSESHRSPKDIDLDSLGTFEEYSIGKVISLYGYYKLLLNSYAMELSRRINVETEPNIGIFSLCPGPVNSNIARAAPSVFKPLLKLVFGLFFSSPKKAAKPVLYLACSPDLNKRTDIYLHLMQHKEMDAKALDSEMGRLLWERSEALLVGHV